MNTNELVSETAIRQDMSKAETRRILDAFVSAMSDSLVNAGALPFPVLGLFWCINRANILRIIRMKNKR
jgi:nucleoid DNA-binding protein